MSTEGKWKKSACHLLLREGYFLCLCFVSRLVNMPILI